MKTYLLLGIFVFSSLFSNAQNATNSTITFNHLIGISENQKNDLDDVYHKMNRQNYHCFTLVNQKEISMYQPSKLLGIVKARAECIQSYFINEQGVDPQNVFMKYDGSYPALWLLKTKSILSASGEINLEDKYRQCYSYNTSTSKTIYTDHGSTFYFQANAFETMAGKGVISNNIDICIWEFTDKKSLIYANLTTHSGDRMLETGGSFYIEAKLKGEPLQLKKGESFTVHMRANTTYPDMFTYYGNTKEGIIDWEVDKTEPVLVNGDIMTNQPTQVYVEDDFGDPAILQETWSEDEGDESFYELTSGKLGWINCDRFYEVKNTSVLAIKVDTKEPVVVRLVFRDIESVMPCYSTSNHKDQYEASGIPTGEKVLVLAYSVKGDNAVLGYKEVVIGQNKVETLTLNNLSKVRFEGAVSELLSY